MALRLKAAALGCAFCAAPALADPVTVDLNATHIRDGACQFVFVGRNGSGADLSQLVLEAVLFDTDGRVAVMTLLDMQDLPAGRTRVRSFEIGGIACDGIGRLLVNGVSACSPAGSAGCTAPLVATSSIGIEVLE
ncbi:MAG: hypothetical protein H6898_07970 [Rhodobacter sp.]|nr:hypothetical protein [Paracoccaceae bacterium]MCC0076509.1 hypothetical protein [Rhodobacter sp.]